jgi:hypothetical protein
VKCVLLTGLLVLVHVLPEVLKLVLLLVTITVALRHRSSSDHLSTAA